MPAFVDSLARPGGIKFGRALIPLSPPNASDYGFEAAMQLLDCAFEQAKLTAGYL